MIFMVAIFSLCSLSSFALQMPMAETERDSGVHYVGQELLHFRGAAVHRRFIFDIYELSLYLHNSAAGPEEIVSSVENKYARMRFLRAVKATDLRKGFLDTFTENCAPDCETLGEQLKIFLAAIPDMPGESVIEFVFYPDRTLVSVPERSALVFPGIELGRLFLKSWVGSKPPSERFKRELLGH